ncbi:MAG: hypothetical protein DCC43_09850 [Candidatus Brocadia sp.]|nr:ATP-dependent helicase/deoxyribonuclease subunit B [Candidatus Brocadia fulgida]MCC6325294.1 exodeoxyribonuclease V subunit gamma [Candidatus Brocadia sp.]MCE7912343.1 hypothetical protein [Candidatus Brocadia sp. AMX3]MDG5996898.1 hypothetical protein [Candidatus Brocadia sp.]RIJ97785.1 MAG: hypothetical protein DCC43_09850 [Candidatus Brocadia sp.]
MLSVKLGPYHPSLEDSFVETIQTLKRDDPLAPLAVVAPTNWMLRRLQERLAQRNDAAFLNIVWMNFFTLAKEICRQSGVDTGRIIQQAVIYESVIAGLLKQQMPQASPFQNVLSLPALSKAIFQVIQDLNDANVHLDVMQEAIREGFVEGVEIRKLYGIMQLFDTFRQKVKTLNISHYADVYRMAAECVPDSAFLRGFQHILAYGFYDLTGVEQDFFGEIFKYHPTILFLPYRKKHPAFAYVKPFFESFVLGMAHDMEELAADQETGFSFLIDSPLEDSRVRASGPQVAGEKSGGQQKLCHSQPETRNPKPVIINVSGKRDEVWTVAKEILKLTAEGYKMEEIGVVARLPNSYANAIKKIFYENGIPFMTSMQESIGRYPLVKVIQQMLQLMREDFYRPMVIELLSSPYFKTPGVDYLGFVPRPDLWDMLSRRLRIRGGISCWLARLAQAKDMLQGRTTGDSDTPPPLVPPSEEDANLFSDNEEAGRHIPVPASQIECLENILTTLSHDLSSLPERASWTILGQKIAQLLRDYIHVPSDGMHPDDHERDLLILDKIGGLLRTLDILDCLGEEVTRDQYIDTFLDACRQESLPMGLKNGRGVKVLDAMSARGIPFRALFVLGLNEKVFPRAISEEPFLRDHVRRRLSEVLGNVLPEKLRGFEEERLLFSFLLNAARERLYLLYERSDEAGKPRVQSHYLMDIIQTMKERLPSSKESGERAGGEMYVSRSIKEKLCKQEISLLAPKEIGIRMALDRINPAHVLEAFKIDRHLFDRSHSALGLIEGYHPRLTSYDGVVGDMTPWWDAAARRGFSPTALETFGACPFRFFMGRILELEFLEEPETAEMIASVDLGTLYHSILRDFYHILMEKGYFTTKTKERDPIELLQGIVQKYFAEIERQMPILYPIVWEVEKEEILVLLTRFVTWDLEQIGKSGFIPTCLEKTVKLRIQNDLLKPVPGHSKQDDPAMITFRGKIDRIDMKPAGDTASYRVIDYKSGRFFREDLARAAIRGQRLQLPFYIIMAEEVIAGEIRNGRIPQGQTKMDEASFVYVAEHKEEKTGQISPHMKTISSNEWMDCKEQYRETLWEFLKIIREGIFPVSPGEDTQKCEWCEFSTMCRRGHQPLRFRLEQDTRLKKYREIMNLKVSKKSGKT